MSSGQWEVVGKSKKPQNGKVKPPKDEEKKSPKNGMKVDDGGTCTLLLLLFLVFCIKSYVLFMLAYSSTIGAGEVILRGHGN